jgi:peptide/nickel transport system permease protein
LVFLLRRLGQLLLVLLLGSFLVFALTEFSPGSVARRILGPYATDGQVQLLTARLGDGDGLLARYGRWLGQVAGLRANPLLDPAVGLGLVDPRGERYLGNLGVSLMLREPVLDVVADRLGHTARLAGISVALVVPIALGLGLAAGLRPGSATDRGTSALTVILTSLPEFVVAVALVLLFSGLLGWLPGTSPLDPGDRWSPASQMVLPVTVLVVASAAYVARIVRSSVADTVRRPFVQAARLRGLSPRRVVLLHVLRAALVAPVTVILLQVNWLLSGVVVVESIFAYPGVGSLMLDAALFGDVVTVQALTLIALVVAVATQALGDLAYVLLDPRIRT